ncbi:hypothetical protein scyTo_0004302 [Scyliorhinus torazame]|uniref:PH domain-containing protein n=1 Tax=Scyliorhinus torazame TaxID=75743 RepID=A0A401NPD2_SCYTO|nr:hypothetical protein [Scyliorhinus torazame]
MLKFSDLKPEEQEEIQRVREHKEELQKDIQTLKMEIAKVITELENFNYREESVMAERNKQMSVGKKKFNMDPKKGIEHLIQNKLLSSKEEEIAKFLYKGEGLHKTAIGDYLGEREPFYLRILQCFVELHEFAGLNLVQALSLHNPNVKEKPGLERFVAMNRGINNGGDLPHELLRNLYDSIRNEPFKIPEDDGNDLTHTFFNPDREGWLSKLGGRVKTWKRRWFILTDNCLYYFEYTTNCFDLYSPNSKGHTIKACKTDTDGRVVEGNHRFYRISATSREERDEWIKSIRASITRDPFYDMVSARKKKLTVHKSN